MTVIVVIKTKDSINMSADTGGIRDSTRVNDRIEKLFRTSLVMGGTSGTGCNTVCLRLFMQELNDLLSANQSNWHPDMIETEIFKLWSATLRKYSFEDRFTAVIGFMIPKSDRFIPYVYELYSDGGAVDVDKFTAIGCGAGSAEVAYRTILNLNHGIVHRSVPATRLIVSTVSDSDTWCSAENGISTLRMRGGDIENLNITAEEYNKIRWEQ